MPNTNTAARYIVCDRLEQLCEVEAVSSADAIEQALAIGLAEMGLTAADLTAWSEADDAVRMAS